MVLAAAEQIIEGEVRDVEGLVKAQWMLEGRMRGLQDLVMRQQSLIDVLELKVENTNRWLYWVHEKSPWPTGLSKKRCKQLTEGGDGDV